jgi:hypothetical protein
MTTQGAEANNGGNFLERIVETEFTSRGVHKRAYSENGDNADMFSEKLLLTNVPYTSIYGGMSRSEFVYRHFEPEFDIRILCFWQEAAGSVDEKLPYHFLNAREMMPEREIWMVYGGNGARQGAIEWLKRAASNTTKKTIRVMSVTEFRPRVKAMLAGSGRMAAE